MKTFHARIYSTYWAVGQSSGLSLEKPVDRQPCETNCGRTSYSQEVDLDRVLECDPNAVFAVYCSEVLPLDLTGGVPEQKGTVRFPLSRWAEIRDRLLA